MTERTSWREIKKSRSDAAQRAYEDEARVSEFRDLLYRLRTEAGLTQAELALRTGTTQSAIARIEGGGTRPRLETLEKIAQAVGADLVIGAAPGLGSQSSMKRLISTTTPVREAVVSAWTGVAPDSKRVGRAHMCRLSSEFPETRRNRRDPSEQQLPECLL